MQMMDWEEIQKFLSQFGKTIPDKQINDIPNKRFEDKNKDIIDAEFEEVKETN